MPASGHASVESCGRLAGNLAALHCKTSVRQCQTVIGCCVDSHRGLERHAQILPPTGPASRSNEPPGAGCCWWLDLTHSSSGRRHKQRASSGRQFAAGIMMFYVTGPQTQFHGSHSGWRPVRRLGPTSAQADVAAVTVAAAGASTHAFPFQACYCYCITVCALTGDGRWATPRSRSSS